MNPLCIPLKPGDRWESDHKWLALHGEGGKVGTLQEFCIFQSVLALAGVESVFFTVAGGGLCFGPALKAELIL